MLWCSRGTQLGRFAFVKSLRGAVIIKSRVMLKAALAGQLFGLRIYVLALGALGTSNPLAGEHSRPTHPPTQAHLPNCCQPSLPGVRWYAYGAGWILIL